jgi:DNA polymerase-3 subunit alpha
MFKDIQELNSQIKVCQKCKLAQVREKENGKIVIGRGSKNPDILFVGEGPGQTEMQEGRPFCGRSGKLLDIALEKNNIKDYAIVNIVKCHPPGNRPPEKDEIDACKSWLEEQIKLLNPKTIVPLGNTALKFFFPKNGITSSHKQCFELNGRQFIPLYHPAYILRNPSMRDSYIKDFTILNNNSNHVKGESIKEEIKKNHIHQEISIKNFQEDVLPFHLKIDGQSQPFVHLHNHTERGSPGDVYRNLDEWAIDLKEKGFGAGACTDHGSCSGLYYFQRAMQKQNIKPILGVELYIKEGAKTSHMVLLVKNEIGWQNLLKIRRESWLNRDAGKKVSNNSRSTIESVLENHEGLICSTACINGFLGYKVKNQLEYEPMILKFKEVFGEDFYLEVQPHIIPEQVMVNKVVIQLHEKYNIPIIITADTHYTHKEDKEIHNIVEALRYRRVFHKDVTINDNPGFTGNTYYNLTSEDIDQLVEENHSYLKPYLTEAMANTIRIAEKCNFILPSSYQNTLPEIPDAEEYVAQKIASNMHLVAHHDPKLIQERLDLELTRIRNKNFLPYFVIVARLFEYAKLQGIPCGPGRGSSGGSLVSYLLGITKVDPIRFNLLFERFYSEARIDPPDIDSDFSQERREELIGYLKSQYGNDNVSNIITFSKWKGKGVFRDVCRIYNIPLSQVNLVAKFIESTKEGHDIQEAIDKNDIVREFYVTNPKVMDIAKALEGHTNFYGKHAAGIVICPNLAQKIPLEAIKDAELTSWEKDALGELGIIKLDLLGLSILDEIDRTITNANLTWEDLPYEFEDPKVYDLLNKGLTMGVHQFETLSATQYVQKVHPDAFQELIDITCLNRPGPTKAGAALEYVLRKNSKSWEYYHSIISDITKETKGLIITQEQVMRIVNKVGGFSLEEAEKVRKIIGKSKGSDALNKKREQFINGAIEQNGLTKEEAEGLFDKLVNFGGYGFNKCLSGDTQIFDANTGCHYTIEFLFKNQNKIFIWSMNNQYKLEKQPILNIYDNGIQDVFEIKTRTGRKIKTTINHKFYTIDGWKELSNLKIYSHIALPRLIPNNISNPVFCEEFKLIVLAYALTEGNLCHPHGFYIYSTDKLQIREYVQALRKFNNVRPSVGKDDNKLYVYSAYKNQKNPNEADLWMRSLNLYGKKATQKEIPEFIFSLAEDQLSLFIAKMWEGDGCIFTGKNDSISIYYATSSEVMAYQVVELLLKLGVYSSVFKKYFKYRGGVKIGYTVQISGKENFANFIHKTYPFLTTKRYQADKVLYIISNFVKNVKIGTRDIIPKSIVTEIKEEILKTGTTIRQFCINKNISERNLYMDPKKKGFGRKTISNFGVFLNSSRLQNLANSDLYWDEIKSIEYIGQEQTYDVEVKDNHNLIANNIIVHNSHAVAYSFLTYWSAWLKANYPLETFAAFIDNANSEQLAIYIREAQEMGIIIKPPSMESPYINNSFNKEKNTVYIGLHLLQQIGESEAQVIISSGKSFARLKKNVSERTLKILIEVGYFDSIESNRKQLYRNLELSKNTLSRFLEEPTVYQDWSINEKLTRMRKHLSWPHSSSELPETIYDKNIITLDQYNKERDAIETPILLKGWIYNIREFDSKDGNSKTAYLEFGDGSSGARIALVLPYGLFNTYKNVVEQVKTGELVDSIMVLVNPYFNSFKAGLHKKEGKLNILKIFKSGEQISDKILRVLNLEELQLKKNQMVITSTQFGTSKKGNQYCVATTIDHLGFSGKGLIMMNKSPITPDIGGIINGRWSEEGFLTGN